VDAPELAAPSSAAATRLRVLLLSPLGLATRPKIFIIKDVNGKKAYTFSIF
jgi:hypothetical protein